MTLGPLRVVEFTNSAVRGGAEEHILTLLRRLDRNRFQPYLACPGALAEMLAPNLPADVEVFRIEFSKPYQLRAGWKLARWLRQRRIQILHSHLFCSSLCASPVGWFAGVSAVIETPHLSERWRRGWKESFVIDRLVGRFVDAYVAVSQANARYLVQEKRLPAEKIWVILNGIDPTPFNGPQTGVERLRHHVGIAKESQVVVVIGRLEPQKGHAVLLRAFVQIHRAIPATQLVIVGDGRLRSTLEEQPRALGIENAVNFVGWQASVADWLALADVVVLPSLYEGLPLAALEALAAARPLVATAVDGTPEIARDGETGITVPPGDAVALASAVLHLLRDVTYAKKLGCSGRELILQKFTDSRQAKETEQLYEEVWSGRWVNADTRSDFRAHYDTLRRTARS